MDTDRASDNELIEAVRKGAPGADRYLDALYKRYYTKVAHWCLHICGNREEARDLAQEVFLRAHSRLDSFRMESQFSTWLYTVTRSVTINRGMQAKRHRDRFKSANEGTIGSYVHFDSRTAVIVEVNCETDFVANTDDFKQLAKDLALHIASTSPLAVSKDDIAEEVIARERAVYMEQVKEAGKPPEIAEKIVEGKLGKFFKEMTLLSQPFVKDSDKSIEELITEVSSKCGEKIEVARFSRFKVGEGA